MPGRRQSLQQRMAAKVDRSAGPDGCWPFTGTKKDGYGKIDAGAPFAGKPLKAHRVAYAIANQINPLEMPPSAVIRHTCDNRPCCNPAHLLIGTPADNVRDMHERGRYNSPVAWTDGKCRNGHDVTDPANVVMPDTRWRRCRACKTERLARQRALVAA